MYHNLLLHYFLYYVGTIIFIIIFLVCLDCCFLVCSQLCRLYHVYCITNIILHPPAGIYTEIRKIIFVSRRMFIIYETYIFHAVIFLNVYSNIIIMHFIKYYFILQIPVMSRSKLRLVSTDHVNGQSEHR